jgi:hypothetical protein
MLDAMTYQQWGEYPVPVLRPIHTMLASFFNWVDSGVKRVLAVSVFKPLSKGTAMDSILTAMFHRLSATLYLIYCIWAVVAVIDGIPSLAQANGEQWQTLFSMAVFVFAAPSCFGATFWPNFARLELFAGAGFTTLLGVYVFFLLGNAVFNGSPLSYAVILTSVLVVPLARLIIVVMFLLRQAEERREMNAVFPPEARQSVESEGA